MRRQSVLLRFQGAAYCVDIYGWFCELQTPRWTSSGRLLVPIKESRAAVRTGVSRNITISLPVFLLAPRGLLFILLQGRRGRGCGEWVLGRGISAWRAKWDQQLFQGCGVISTKSASEKYVCHYSFAKCNSCRRGLSSPSVSSIEHEDDRKKSLPFSKSDKFYLFWHLGVLGCTCLNEEHKRTSSGKHGRVETRQMGNWC